MGSGPEFTQSHLLFRSSDPPAGGSVDGEEKRYIEKNIRRSQ